MEITEVRIKLMEDTDDRLQGFCSITFDDCFVIRDLKIIEGSNGPFVAMPSRKLTAHCPKCGCKNHLRAAYCNQCGLRLKDDLAVKDTDGRAKLYADIAHPINSACREMIQQRVISEFREEVDRSKEPGYVSRYDDFYESEERSSVPSPKFVERNRSAKEDVDHQERLQDKSESSKPTSGERRHVEPAASEPRGPHTIPSAKTPSSKSAKGEERSQQSDQQDNDQFGAGIL